MTMTTELLKLYEIRLNQLDKASLKATSLKECERLIQWKESRHG